MISYFVAFKKLVSNTFSACRANRMTQKAI